jgi:hypothetical protein
MLVLDPTARIGLDGVVSHPWITTHAPASVAHMGKAIKNLKGKYTRKPWRCTRPPHKMPLRSIQPQAQGEDRCDGCSVWRHTPLKCTRAPRPRRQEAVQQGRAVLAFSSISPHLGCWCDNRKFGAVPSRARLCRSSGGLASRPALCTV